jgi:DNA-binding NarL/FixJ family response regulator
VAQYALLDVLACHAAGTGRPALAARLIGAAETVQRGVGATIIPYIGPLIAQARASTRAALGGPAFQSRYDEGRGLSRSAAIELALGETTPTTSPSATTTPLSKREAEVARLVAEGLSNKQIATKLLISEYTVDSHVRSVLAKLGFRSRAQVAAWLASAGRSST